MKLALIVLAALAVLALVWAVVLPQLGMGAQVAAWRAYKRRKEGAGRSTGGDGGDRPSEVGGQDREEI